MYNVKWLKISVNFFFGSTSNNINIFVGSNAMTVLNDITKLKDVRDMQLRR